MTNLSVVQLKEAIRIKEQIEELESRLERILGDNSAKASAPVKRGPRKMSADARARISAAAKARWAKIKGKPAAAKPSPKKKGGMTPEGRAKIAAAMKARWAARRKESAA